MPQAKSPVVVEPSPEAAPLSATELLQAARRQIRQGRYAEAADAYATITSAHPQSEEAHTVRVSLGQLYLVRLGQPQRALEELDAYLAQGAGPLAEEARATRIGALRALGRVEDEVAAIEDFLAKHPRSFEANALRSRLTALRSGE